MERTAPPPTNLFTYSDGSVLKKMRMSELMRIETWEGNRTVDRDHVAHIKETVCGSIQALDKNTYTIVSYTDEETGDLIYRIIDGQHRVRVCHAAVLDGSFQDFQVLVRHILCKCETDVIAEFQKINNTKAIPLQDSRLNIHPYVQELEVAFAPLARRNRAILFRRGERTMRPYMSVKKLYEHMEKAQPLSMPPKEYAAKALFYNTTLLDSLRTRPTRTKMEETALRLGFALALDEKYGWILTIHDSL
jgi:hypothetical protein